MKFHVKYQDQHKAIPMDVIDAYYQGGRMHEAPLWDSGELEEAMDAVVPEGIYERHWAVEYAFEQILSDMYEGGQRRGHYDIPLDEDATDEIIVKWWIELTPQEEEEWGDLYWSKKPARFPEERE